MKFYGWGYNTGDGIRMAQKVGADLWHMDVIAGGNLGELCAFGRIAGRNAAALEPLD